MKTPISAIPQLYRNARRVTEIAAVLSKYGLAQWLSQTNIDFLKNRLTSPAGEKIAQQSLPARVRLALTELGPTFIKMGQLLSTRPDVVGIELADELASLQADVPAEKFAAVKQTIESAHGAGLGALFATFDETPIASASIGQVHRATLASGTEVVVKVRRTNIEKSIDTDLDILSGMAQLASRVDEFKHYQPVQVAQEMSRTMRRELDFESEMRHLEQFRVLFARDRTVEIPEPVPELCSEEVLTMHQIVGCKLTDPDRYGMTEKQLSKLAKHGANVYLKMIFEHGFYHADPHPGNLLILKQGALGLLDFGMVGRISENSREDIETILMAIVSRDVPLLVSVVKRLCSVPLDLEETRFANDLSDFVSQYSTLELSRFDMSRALSDFVGIVRRYHITLPSDVSMLIKVLVTLEGSSRLLNPKFSLLEVMQPYHRMLALKRLSPTRQLKKLRRLYWSVDRMADQLPGRLSSILEQIQKGKFDVHLDHRRLGPTVNRLVMGLLTSALFLGSALMLSYKVPPLLFPDAEASGSGINNLSVLGLAGCVVSILLGLRLLWAIRKSGNLDEGS